MKKYFRDFSFCTIIDEKLQPFHVSDFHAISRTQNKLQNAEKKQFFKRDRTATQPTMICQSYFNFYILPTRYLMLPFKTKPKVSSVHRRELNYSALS